MKPKKSKPKPKGSVNNPRPKSFQIKSLRSRTPTQISPKEKKRQIRTEIARLKLKRRQIIGDLEKHINKIKNLSISLSGLETLSETSVDQIQDKRRRESLNFENLAGDFAVNTRKLDSLEKKYRRFLEK